MEQNYYDSMEDIDDVYFQHFSTTLFDGQVNRQEKYSRCDFTTSNTLDGNNLIELKTRYGTIDGDKFVTESGYRCDTVFIEESKFDWLISTSNRLETKYSKECGVYYINFINDEKSVLVWKLKEIPKPQLRHNIKIWDKGSHKYVYENRYLLPISQAKYYKWNEKEGKYS